MWDHASKRSLVCVARLLVYGNACVIFRTQHNIFAETSSQIEQWLCLGYWKDTNIAQTRLLGWVPGQLARV